jgi:hypothetical protein
MNEISVRSGSDNLAQVLRDLPRYVNHPGYARDAVNALLVRVGLEALSRIKQAFIAKAKGGTDEAGERWPKLERSTVAYSRRHPGVLWPGKKRAPFRPSWMLTEKERKRWWELNAQVGAAMAWIILKDEGAKTLIGEYGDTKVETLRDTGLLLNSLSPGVPGSQPNQVFRVGDANVIIGTNREHAVAHHNGVPGKLPQRRLWPPPSKWPASWWGGMLSQLRQGMIDVVARTLRR